MNLLSHFCSIWYFKDANLWSLLGSLLWEIDICAHWVFYTKLISERCVLQMHIYDMQDADLQRTVMGNQDHLKPALCNTQPIASLWWEEVVGWFFYQLFHSMLVVGIRVSFLWLQSKAGNTPEHTVHRGMLNLPLRATVYSTQRFSKWVWLASCVVHPDSPAVGPSKPSMWRSCFYHVFIFHLVEENAQLFFDKVRQTAACRARFNAPGPCSNVFPT